MAPKATALKTEALSIRIDPRLRFGLELLSRNQRRSVTGVVEWAVERALKDERIEPLTEFSDTFAEVIAKTWSPNEAERLVNLATHYPDLLTYEESRMWRVITGTGKLNIGFSNKRHVDISVLLREWEKLRPLIVAASERSVVRGLTDEELDKSGIDLVPF